MLRRWLEALERYPRIRTTLTLGVAPALLYFTCFVILTWPMISWFSAGYFADQGDGLQNVWNLWWVNKAVTELGQHPWHTQYLHHPWGVTLLAHTLNAFNGFVGIPLQTVLTLEQTHNVIVLFSFVMGGMTAFWLALRVTGGATLPSLVAGYIFTFSNYHFAHAQGHLQLVSLEWIPAFLLAWVVLVTKPSLRGAALAALALIGVFYCDYYYFFYCVLAGAFALFWYAWKARSWRFLIERPRLVSLALFAVLVIAATAPLVVSLLLLNASDPLQGVHEARRYSADLLSYFIPGGHWTFSNWTRGYWGRLPGNIHEKSVHLGLSVIALMGWLWFVRRRVRAELGYWTLLLGFFAVVSLGPVLQIVGHEISWFKLPYAALEVVFPPLRLSGCPVRMAVMVSLAAGVLCAVALKQLLADGRRARVVAALFVAALVFEYWPRPMPVTRLPAPGWALFLRDLPGEPGIVEQVSAGGRALYYHTLYGKPRAFGYVSRSPTSLIEREKDLRRAIGRRDLSRLRTRYEIDYLVVKSRRGAVVIETTTGNQVFPVEEVEEKNVEPPTVRVQLSLVEVEKQGDRWKVMVEARFTNVGGGVFELDKATACENGHVSNHVFDVRRGEEEIAYHGMMKKRAHPGPDGFFRIGAGETYAVQVDIGEQYELPASGEVEVRFDHFNHFSKHAVQLSSEPIRVRLE